MRQLTTKQRFAFTFTLYVFGFLIVLYSLFFVIFTFMTNYQIKKDLSDDMNEIVNNHLLLDNNRIIFRKDKTGASLKQFLLNENASSVIVDAKKNIVRSYGSFVYDGSGDKEFNRVLLPLIDRVFKSKSLFETQIVWNKQNFTVMVIPLINSHTLIGSLILSKSTADLFAFRQNMLTVFSILGFMSLVGSFIVGYLLARNTLNPLVRLSRVAETMDLENLESRLSMDGNPQDELVILVRKFNEMIGRLKEMTSRQKEFIANASHELKTPLTRAITSLEVLDVTPETKEEVKLIKEDLFHINTLLEKLLLLSRLNKDSHLVSHPKKIRLDALFSQVRKQFVNQCDIKRLKLNMIGPETVESRLPKEYLEIILSNLVSNAIKYSRSGGYIKLICKVSGRKTEIEVRDSGEGMAEDERSRIFDRFYRGKSASRLAKGYGVGLSIVKHICDIYKIGLTVDSHKDSGTTVRLTW